MCRRFPSRIAPSPRLWLLVLALIPAQPGAPASEGPARDAADPTPKASPREAEIKVQSRDAAQRARSRTGTDFLRPPGSGRYEPDPTDWRDVPPWRQTSFYGIRARGQFFVYVVDCSGSMIDDDRLVRAKRELRRSVFGLQPTQRFQVIFYNDRALPWAGTTPRSADLTAKNQFNQWLRLIEPDGETDPRSAMSLALSLQPDAVFLLSDGEFPAGTVEAIAARNTRKVPIHSIDLSGGLAGDQLSRIARDSGGRYASRPPRDDELSP
jgi:hypothetical protein